MTLFAMLAPGAVPFAATVLHEVHHSLERVAGHGVSSRLESIAGRPVAEPDHEHELEPGTGRFVHAHGPGEPVHGHNAAVDHLLTLGATQADDEADLSSAHAAPPRLDPQYPARVTARVAGAGITFAPHVAGPRLQEQASRIPPTPPPRA